VTQRRILVVDDEPGMIRSVERVLEKQYDVASSRSPGAAIELAESFEPDLAILDIRMPEMDGFELMERLKKMQPELDVILMTGSVDELDKKLIRALRQEAFYFIQKPFDREVLQTLVARCLKLRKLAEENRLHLQRVDGELAEARSFQLGLLPPREVHLEGVGISARYLSCTELGGDFYDFAAAGTDRATILVADVSGHGVSAAMLTGIVKSAFHASRDQAYEPRWVIRQIASGIRSFGYERFITAFCARLSSRSPLVIEYVNAGHPPGILWGEKREPKPLESTGPLISSAFPTADWEQATIDLERGDQVLLYTDGVEEALAETAGPAAGKIDEWVLRCRKGGPALVDSILRAGVEGAGGRPGRDDMTLLTARLG
jgi:sigma-B regulation protein RsbU (phosphoserine phosphatase)